MRIYGHRGSSARLPENTLAALRGAIEDGADGVEFDVHASRDRVPVLVHDRDLARTTSGSGDVDAFSLAELGRLDAGNGERIPTLAEALDALAGRLSLDVELKQAGAERAVLDALGRHPDTEWFISSFDWDILRTVRALDPGAELWVLTEMEIDEAFDAARELGARGIAFWSPIYTPEIADRTVRDGLLAAVWTVNDPDEARRVRNLGADVLISDDPAAIRRALA